MIRKRGYAMRGEKVAIRGDFQRKPRGTFDRVSFVECCPDIGYSDCGNVRQYPGSNSVWILDEVTIHRHPEIVHYLHSVGVIPIFLLAYCPFFNPIEFMLGYMKRAFQRYYNEPSSRDLTPFGMETFQRLESFNMAFVFEQCEWTVQGHFNPVGLLSKDTRKEPDIWENEGGVCEDDNDLGFSTLR
ncbi:hypothetical protein JG687_00009266 [Phytophthora cactorum]|uniref:Tc1-like transposase DDE domain-containing protein n=1 Tax=Phytophthora cactorum TaxID=29920 RepID=A0A8T1UEH0_9STRA|nr:hypothetical protein JG687_00009266 [Phytophthora cactorum]